MCYNIYSYIYYNTGHRDGKLTDMLNNQSASINISHPVPPPMMSLLDEKQDKWQNHDTKLAQLKQE